MEKPHITYPLYWEYRLIGKDPDRIISYVRSLMKNVDYTLTKSHISKDGTYTTVKLKVYVHTEAERTTLFAQLKESDHIRLIL
ncbi:MAG: HP0495 family protein [Fibrobacterota bacterium]